MVAGSKDGESSRQIQSQTEVVVMEARERDTQRDFTRHCLWLENLERGESSRMTETSFLPI